MNIEIFEQMIMRVVFNDFCTAPELLKWPTAVDIIHITSMV